MKRIAIAFDIVSKLLKGSFQLLYGSLKIGKLPYPIVTIFGSARLTKNSQYIKMAHTLGHMLVNENISVITGGGPGIMEAASCGASHSIKKRMSVRSIGISVSGLDERKTTECAQEYLILDRFFARKWLMIHYSVAFAIFPGGFGTLNELTEIITLIKIKRLPGVPIVLIGTEFWQPLYTWLSDLLLKNDIITLDDLQLMRITDSLSEAVALLKERCQACNVPLHKIEKK